MNQETPKTTELAEASFALPSVAVQEAAADARGVRDRESRFFYLAHL
jgi:hypothetical protein